MSKVVLEKRCPGCKQVKPASDFAPAPYRYDGLRASCRECTRIKSRGWAKSKPKKRDPVMEGTKVCSGCEVEKDIAEFSIDRVQKDGRRSKCKDCESIRTANYRTERVITDEMRKKWRQRRRKADPRKKKAQSAITTAIRSGRLSHVGTHKCATPGCGKDAQEYHHWSYKPEHWLSLIPLCTSHHRQVHTGRVVLNPQECAIEAEPKFHRRLLPDATSKFCHGCKRDLPLSAFGVDRSKPYGRASRCRECNRKK